MNKQIAAAVLEVLGLLSVAAAGFLVDPAVGFLLLGIALGVLGFALERGDR